VPAAIASRKFCFSWSESAHACPHWLPITVISSPVSIICSRRSRRMLVPCLSSGHCGQRETKETIVFLLESLWRDCSMVQDRGEKGEVDLPRDFSLTRPTQEGNISEERQSKAKSNMCRWCFPLARRFLLDRDSYHQFPIFLHGGQT
jgi:hypothetical protein